MTYCADLLKISYIVFQVEAYSKDLLSSQQNNNFYVNPHYDSKHASPKKQAPGPPSGVLKSTSEPPNREPAPASSPPRTEPEPIYAVPDKSRKRLAPARPTESLQKGNLKEFRIYLIGVVDFV